MRKAVIIAIFALCAMAHADLCENFQLQGELTPGQQFYCSIVPDSELCDENNVNLSEIISNLIQSEIKW